jgi:peptidoglycan/LPS O-acetylase OafA/YrhL
VLGAFFSGADVLVSGLLLAPGALLVTLFGGLIFSLAALTKAGENSGEGSLFVYMGEISYSIYVVCIPWKLLFVNAVAPLLHFDKAHLPLYRWLVMYAAIIPLSAMPYHLAEPPARRWMKRRPAAGVKALISVA